MIHNSKYNNRTYTHKYIYDVEFLTLTCKWSRNIKINVYHNLKNLGYLNAVFTARTRGQEAFNYSICDCGNSFGLTKTKITVNAVSVDRLGSGRLIKVCR